MSFCEKLIKENSIEVEPVNEGFIGSAIKGIFIAIGALVAASYGAEAYTKMKDEEFLKKNPHIKKLIGDLNTKCKEAIKKAADNDPCLKELPAKNLKPATVNFKPAWISNDIFEIDYTKICHDNGIGDDFDYGTYGELIIYGANDNAKKAYDACKKELKKIKDAVKTVSEQIKSEKHGKLVTVGISVNTNPDEEEEYREDSENEEYIIGCSLIYVSVDIRTLINNAGKKPVNEAAEENQDPPREEQKKALSDLEFSYDKKYNAFCLSVSGYSTEKLENMLQKKTEELKTAKEEKQKAPTRYSRMAAQVKIDYLVNVTNRCKAMIRKKKSYHKAEEKN